MDFEKIVQTVIKEIGLTRKEAIAELTVFMCGNGTTEDFKNFINFLIKDQKNIESKESVA